MKSDIPGSTNSMELELIEKDHPVAGRGEARKGRVHCRQCVPRRFFSQMLREGVDHLTHLNGLA